MATRTKQLAKARRDILDATAELVSERRLLNFTLAEVAERSGKSPRTVYNHFATREDLLRGLNERFDESAQALGAVYVHTTGSLDDVPAAARANFRIFDELGGLAEAFARLGSAEGPATHRRDSRTEAFTVFARRRFPELDPDKADHVAVLIRHVVSSRSWYGLTRELGLPAETAGDLVAWLVQLIIRGVDDGDLPPRRPPAAADASA